MHRRLHAAMPEEGDKGQQLPLPFSMGGEGGKRCPAQIHIVIMVTSLFAPISVFPLLFQHRKEEKCFFVNSCSFANFRIFNFN